MSFKNEEKMLSEDTLPTDVHCRFFRQKWGNLDLPKESKNSKNDKYVGEK